MRRPARILFWTATLAGLAGLAGTVFFPPAAGPSGRIPPVQALEEPLVAAAATPKEESGNRQPLQSVAESLRPWEAVIGELNDRAGDRGRTLEETLGRPDLIPWLLQRLERADFPPAWVRPLGYLLRGVLAVWDRLPADPPLDRGECLRRIITAGAAADPSAEVVRFAWSRQRFLSPAEQPLVDGARPSDLSRPAERKSTTPGWSFAGTFPSLRPKARMFLTLLEDLLSSYLDAGRLHPVETYLRDPDEPVRFLALKLLLTRGEVEDWTVLWEEVAALSPAARQDLAGVLVRELPPQKAAALLQAWQTELSEKGESYLAPWMVLAGRSSRAVDQVLREELDSLAPPEDLRQISLAGPTPNDQYQQFLASQEGRMRMELVAALAAGKDASGNQVPVDAGLFEDVARRDWNPWVRQAAWDALTMRTEGRARALALLQDSGFRSSVLNVPMLRKTFVKDLQSLVVGLDSGGRETFLQLLPRLSLSEEQKADLAVLARKTP
ncbi:MAG: hypothetical protein ACE5H3_02700 [Planctomycetota bacterium]